MLVFCLGIPLSFILWKSLEIFLSLAPDTPKDFWLIVQACRKHAVMSRLHV